MCCICTYILVATPFRHLQVGKVDHKQIVVTYLLSILSSNPEWSRILGWYICEWNGFFSDQKKGRVFISVKYKTKKDLKVEVFYNT